MADLKYTDSTYEKIQNVLDNIKYIDAIKVRDLKFVTSKGLSKPNSELRNTKIDEIKKKREKYLNDLVALDELVNNY